MGSNATREDNQKRKKILEEFFVQIWKDGSFVHWVNPKTKKLNVKEVANKKLKINDTSIFSKWAQPFWDEFNEKYKHWKQANGDLTTHNDETATIEQALDGDAPGEHLMNFIRSSIVTSLTEYDEDAMMTVLNSYQAVSCERCHVTVSSMKDRVKELETQIPHKDKQLASQAYTIEFLKKVNVEEEAHYIGSIRNLYRYDVDIFDDEINPE